MLRLTPALRGVLKYGFYRRAAHHFPHPDKQATGGEDAFLSHLSVQAVFDGVSWWNQAMNVDAGLYSAALARSMFDYIHEENLDEVPDNCENPSLEMLNFAYNYCNGSPAGTSTALVASIRDQKLYVASVGDCTLLLVRNGEILLETEEQTHDLDFPFQLGTGSKDTPNSANLYVHDVEIGDIVIIGSDGIFDNIYPADAARRITDKCVPIITQAKALYKQTVPRSVVERICEALNVGCREVLREATSAANDIHSNTPYASKCIENGAYFEGGKIDDMTLLVGVVGAQDEGGTGERFVEDNSATPPPYRDWP